MAEEIAEAEAEGALDEFDETEIRMQHTEFGGTRGGIFYREAYMLLLRQDRWQATRAGRNPRGQTFYEVNNP